MDKLNVFIKALELHNVPNWKIEIALKILRSYDEENKTTHHMKMKRIKEKDQKVYMVIDDPLNKEF